MKVTRGKDIKDLARFVFGVWCIVWVIFFVAIGSLFGKIMHGDAWVGWVLGIVIAGINILVGFLVYMFIDAFGVITDCNEKQTVLLEKLCDSFKAPVAAVQDQATAGTTAVKNEAAPENKPAVKKDTVKCTPQINGDNLVCTKCGASQKVNRSSCFKCGAEFIK